MIKPFPVALALCVYYPLEVFLLKWLPVSDGVYTLLYGGSELIVYALFAQTLLERFAWRRGWRATPIDRLFGLFLLIAMLSWLWNGGSLGNAFGTLRPLVRYVLLFYVVVNLDLTPRQIRLFMNVLLAVGLGEGMLASVQYFAGQSFNELFTPRKIVLDFGGQKAAHFDTTKDRLGSVAGTFAPGGLLGMFLLVPFSILLIRLRLLRGYRPLALLALLLGLAVITFGVFASYKRLALLIACTLPVFLYYLLGDRRALAWLCAAYAVAALFGAVLLSGFLQSSYQAFRLSEAKERQIDSGSLYAQLFTEDYWHNAAHSARLWFLLNVGGHTVSSFKLLGYGPDAPNAVDRIVAENPNLDYLNRYRAYPDVYWVAIMMYFGLLGLICFLAIIYKLYRCARWLLRYSPVPEHREIALMFCLLVLATLLYNFGERTLLVRATSFVFWFAAGLVVNCRYAAQAVAAPKAPPPARSPVRPQLTVQPVGGKPW